MAYFTIEKRAARGRARAGRIETPHGIIETPAFIPVGTKATVKALTMEQVKEYVGADAVLANTYHLYLQPGPDILEKAGGLGKFMDWSGPTFTDSGGFQAFSLQGGMNERKSKFSGKVAKDPSGAALATVDDDGVSFKSVIDGSSHRFTPEKSVEIQHKIGADIIFVLDECAPPEAPRAKQEEAVARTTAWAERCLKRHRELGGDQALFGIVQGGRHEDLRRRSAGEIAAIGFDGFGIGGTFDKDDLAAALAPVSDILPENKPRHLLGIGEPEDILLGIENGMDTFDCVAPTRMGRNGTAYIRKPGGGFGRLNITNAAYREDMGPIDHSCRCYACSSYSRAYISHLFRAKEMLAATLLSIHNLYFLVDLANKARMSILDGSFEGFLDTYMARYSL